MTLIKKLGAPLTAMALFAMAVVSLVAPNAQTTFAANVNCTVSVSTFNNNVGTSVTFTGEDIFSADGAGGAAATDPTASITVNGTAVTLTGLTGVVDAGQDDTITGTVPAANVAGTTTTAATSATGADNTCNAVPGGITFNGLSIAQGETISVPAHGLTTDIITIRGTANGAALSPGTVVTVTTDKGEFTATSSGGAVTPSKSVQLVLAGNVNGAAEGTVTFRAVAGEAAGTANITASASQGGTNLSKQVAITNAVTPLAGTTPTSLALVSNSHSAIGFPVTTAGSEYSPFVRGSLVVFRVTDAAGTGIDGRLIQVTTDRGRLIDASGLADADDATVQAACGASAATTPKTVFVQTVAAANTALGGTGAAGIGRAGVVLCGGAASQAGLATITATDQTNTALTANATVNIATKPTSAGISTSVSGSTVTVTVQGANEVAAPDKTLVRFAVVPTTDGTPVDACVQLTNGTASTTVAVAPGRSAQVVVTAGENATGNCADANVRTYGSSIVTVTGTTQLPTPPAGDGSLTAPNFGTGNVGSAVFAGGSIEQLAEAAADADGTAVWVQGTNGNWYRYSIGATGATAFVNNAFNTQFAAGFSGATPVFVVK